MYTVKFYNKYNYGQCITSKGVTEENCNIIKKTFESKDFLTQRFGQNNSLNSITDLSTIGYIEFIKEQGMEKIVLDIIGKEVREDTFFLDSLIEHKHKMYFRIHIGKNHIIKL